MGLCSIIEGDRGCIIYPGVAIMKDSWPKPTNADLHRAIGLYLKRAYPAGAIPQAVQQRLDRLAKSADPWQGGLEGQGVLECDKPDDPGRYNLRLGNPWYPHMKLAIERSPDGAGYLLRADTHDRHIRPAENSPDYPAFRAMMERNQALSEAIEADWIREGLPTFKEYLRRDLNRRKNL